MSRALSALRRILASTAVLIVVLLVAFDFFISAARPLRYLNATGFTPLDQNPLVAKLPEFMRSAGNPDVLVLGSSLVLVPAVRCDDELEGRRTRYDRWYSRNHINEYTQAKFFSRQISERFGHPVTVANLGVIASMMSDQALILEKALKAGKSPKLVICAIAPRDFLDNYRSQVEKTPVYQVLADLSTVEEVMRGARSLDDVRDFVLGAVWYFYKVKADYRAFALAMTSGLSGHPLDLASAARYGKMLGKRAEAAHPEYDELNTAVFDVTVKADYQAKANTLEDLPTYRNVYNPPNRALFARQVGYFEKMLNLARGRGIELVIVKMPLTRQNTALIEPALKAEYDRRIQALTAKYGVALVDLCQMPGLTLEHFEDSCHMNARGGRVFYAGLADALLSRAAVASALGARAAGRLADTGRQRAH